MKKLRVGPIYFCVFIFSMSAACAWALDAPQTLHRSKSKTESHVTTTRRISTSGSTTHSSVSRTAATRTSARHRSATHIAGRTTASRLSPAAAAHLRNVSYHRRHHYYERFTASSFIQGDVGAGDNTAGEDPVVRQAAIDALGDKI